MPTTALATSIPRGDPLRCGTNSWHALTCQWNVRPRHGTCYPMTQWQGRSQPRATLSQPVFTGGHLPSCLLAIQQVLKRRWLEGFGAHKSPITPPKKTEDSASEQRVVAGQNRLFANRTRPPTTTGSMNAAPEKKEPIGWRAIANCLVVGRSTGGAAGRTRNDHWVLKRLLRKGNGRLLGPGIFCQEVEQGQRRGSHTALAYLTPHPTRDLLKPRGGGLFGGAHPSTFGTPRGGGLRLGHPPYPPGGPRI